jgi:hypothetical protein
VPLFDYKLRNKKECLSGARYTGINTKKKKIENKTCVRVGIWWSLQYFKVDRVELLREGGSNDVGDDTAYALGLRIVNGLSWNGEGEKLR